MFCYKCGKEVNEGAVFCPKCGAKLAANDTVTVQQKVESTPAGQMQSRTNGVLQEVPQKKKSRKLPVLLGAVAVAFVLIIISVISGKLFDNKREHKEAELAVSDAENPGAVSLSETYTNEDEGISFRYPSAWVPVGRKDFGNYYTESDAEDIVAFFANEAEGAPELNSYIEILKFSDSQEAVDHLFANDEEFKETFDDDVSIMETSLIEIDGVSARKIVYVTSEDIIYRSYFYGIGSDLYRVNFLRKDGVSGNLEPFFDAILESYTIAAAQKAESAIPHTTSPVSAEEAQRQLKHWVVDHPLGQYQEYMDLLDEETVSYNGGECYRFELWIDSEVYGDIYVNKDTGEMNISYSSYDDAIGEMIPAEMPLEQWYSDVWLPVKDKWGDPLKEILYNGVPLYSYLGRSLDEVQREFEYYEYFKLGGVYQGRDIFYCRCDGVIFGYVENAINEIVYIDVFPEDAALNGTGLDLTPADLVFLLPNPIYNEYDYEASIYRVQYEMSDLPVTVTFEMSSAIDKAMQVTFYLKQ